MGFPYRLQYLILNCCHRKPAGTEKSPDTVWPCCNAQCVQRHITPKHVQSPKVSAQHCRATGCSLPPPSDATSFCWSAIALRNQHLLCHQYSESTPVSRPVRGPGAGLVALVAARNSWGEEGSQELLQKWGGREQGGAGLLLMQDSTPPYFA